MSASYRRVLDRQGRIALWVDLKTRRGKVVDYSLALVLVTANGPRAIRVYDGAHGYNEMHRYTPEGDKLTGERFHSGSLGEGYNAAIEDIKRSHLKMIEGWEGR